MKLAVKYKSLKYADYLSFSSITRFDFEFSTVYIVTLTDLSLHHKTTNYEQPLGIVEPATSADNLINAFEAAKTEAEISEERRKQKSIQQCESAAKTTVRGKNGLFLILKIQSDDSYRFY